MSTDMEKLAVMLVREKKLLEEGASMEVFTQCCSADEQRQDYKFPSTFLLNLIALWETI